MYLNGKLTANYYYKWQLNDDERLTEEILQQIEKSEKIQEFLRDDFLRDVINHINDVGKGSNPYDAEKILDTVRRNNQIFNDFSEELLNIALVQFWHLRIFYFRIIRELLKQPANKKCFDCPTKGPVYVNLFNDTFVCAKCSGIHREFNHRVKSILASTFTPAEIESLKNGAVEIWLAKYKWVDFPEPDPSDIESIRTLMSMKYKQKKWLDESLLKANNKRPPNGEDYVAKGTFVINSPALSNKLNNSSSNLSDDFSSQHSSLNGHSPVSPTSRKSDNNTSYLKYSPDTYNVVENNTYLESNKISTTTNASFTRQNPLDNCSATYSDQNILHVNSNSNIFSTEPSLLDNNDFNLSAVNYNCIDNKQNPFGHVRHSSLTSIASSNNDDDIFSDFQTAPDVNSQKKMCSTNLNSYKNHTFSNGSTNTNMNSSQQKQFGHSKSISFDGVFSDLDPLKTTSSIFDNNNKITDDPFINLLPLIKSETSKRFPSQKLNDDDIFSDFQAASDVNSRKTMRPTNLNSYKNHTFSNGFTSTSMNSLQQKQFAHSKSISFDSTFSDLDPLHNK
nr:9302_t:CDS:10 [Entrophospora candida]